MTLVERFIGFRDWPTGRKSALAGALVCPALVLSALGLQLGQPDGVDVSMLVGLFLIGAAISAVAGAVAWVAYRRDPAAEWPSFAFVLSYQLWAVVLIVALGGLSTPFLALPLFLPLFTVLWYGVRMGVVSAAYNFAILITAAVLSLLGVVPFAPAMETRSIDGYNSLSWLIIGVISLVVVAIWFYLVGFIAVGAADLQHRRLAETHTQLTEAHDRLGVAHRLIRRYVPEQVADAVLSGAPETIERHERRKLTIFFSDLVGFTDLSEELEPEDLATVLNDYFTAMSDIARTYAGTVDDLIGDAVLVLFGAPDFTDDRDQALRAVRMAIDMQDAMGPLNERWATAGIPETLTVRMGVNTGVATVGNFGSAERTKYTALGKQVNVAARIQSQCQPGKVLLGHTTWLLVRDEIPCTPKGELTLKGLHKPMPAYQVQA